MQRHKSAKKAARKCKRATITNRELRSRIKSAMRNALTSKDKKKAQETMQEAFSILDKCVKVGLIHANNAANKKARLSRYGNSLAEQTTSSVTDA